jgi:hypothetical protein
VSQIEGNPSETALGKEAQFMQWLVEENHRREIQRLTRYLRRLEIFELASYVMMLFWVFVVFIGFKIRTDIVRAEAAGLITVTVLFGGAFIVWHIVRLKRETQQRMAAEEA